jgi:hypothetical protein
LLLLIIIVAVVQLSVLQRQLHLWIQGTQQAQYKYVPWC